MLLITRFLKRINTTLGLNSSATRHIRTIIHGNLVYKFKRIVGKPNFSYQFKRFSNVIERLDITWISHDSLHA